MKTQILNMNGLQNEVHLFENKERNPISNNEKITFRRKFLMLLLFFLSINFTIHAELCTAITNGNWSSASTWSCGHAPTNYDTIWVPNGFSVTVDINSPVYCNMIVIVDGIMIFDVGQKINICPGSFIVSETGILDGGVPGSKINICGTTVWTGPGPEYGPLSWSSWPLPIELTSFQGIQNENSISISWATQTETNNDYFTLERTTNGLTFEEIGVVNGNGTCIEQHNYSFLDLSPASGTNYYRLKQTDFNGQTKTFHMIAVEFNNATSTCVLSVYPNVSTSNFIVTFSDCQEDNNGNIVIQVIDVSGKIILTATPDRNERGGFNCSLAFNKNFESGMYIIRGTSCKSVYQKKIVFE